MAGAKLRHRAGDRAAEQPHAGTGGAAGTGLGSSEDISGRVSHRDRGLDPNLFCEHLKVRMGNITLMLAEQLQNLTSVTNSRRFLLLYCSLSWGHFAFNICNK